MRLTALAGAGDLDPTVEDLRPETIGAVAARTARSRGFAELVYRECEINALWSLADIAVGAAARSAPAAPAVGAPSRVGPLLQLRSAFEEAYRLLAGARPLDAADVLTQAASLGAGGPRAG